MTERPASILLRIPHASRPGGDAATFLRVAREAEDAGFDGVVVPDHVVMGKRPDRYPWGTFAEQPDAPFLEPFVMLAAIAAVTDRIRLTTGILIAPLRPAALLAKAAATLDVISGGRLELGVATGWQQEEYPAVGRDWDDRDQILTDTIAACRVLWTSSPASFVSPTVTFSDVYSEPRPVQAHGPAVLFSTGLSATDVNRIVRLGVGWIVPLASSREVLVEGTAILREAFAAARRDPGTLRIRAHSVVRQNRDRDPRFAESLEAVPQQASDGATEVSVPMADFVRDQDDITPWFTEVRHELSRAGWC
jgi:probable F420-dependent oxidoreductase